MVLGGKALMTNREKALKTYQELQRRKALKAKKIAWENNQYFYNSVYRSKHRAEVER